MSRSKIKLCFVYPGAYQLFSTREFMSHGGAELNLYYLARMFAKDKRYSVSFVVEDQNQDRIEKIDNVKIIKLKGMKWGAYEVKNSPIKQVVNKCLVELTMAKIFINNNFDVVVTSTASLNLSRIVLWNRLGGSAKVIFRFANDTDVNPNYFTQTGGSKMKDILYWWGVQRADELIFQTKQQQKLFNDTEDRKGTIIGNGFYMEDDISIPKSEILWVSRANEVKRPELFLELARRLPHEKFTMIMPGQNQVSRNIQKEVRKIPNLEFIEYVPFNEIIEYYRRAKLFVNTSTFEGFPNTYIHAAMARTPILSFLISPDNILEKYNMGYLSGDSIEYAVELIQSHDEIKIKELGKNARNYVERNHNIFKTKDLYKALIEEVYDSRR